MRTYLAQDLSHRDEGAPRDAREYSTSFPHARSDHPDATYAIRRYYPVKGSETRRHFQGATLVTHLVHADWDGLSDDVSYGRRLHAHLGLKLLRLQLLFCDKFIKLLLLGDEVVCVLFRLLSRQP